MTATLQIKKDRPNYYILIRYKDEAGKERQKWITTDIPIKGNNKRKADTRLKEVLSEYEQQKIDLSRDIMFVDFFKQWLENLEHSIAPTTYDAYNITLNAHLLPYFEPKRYKVKDLAPVHIQQYIILKLKTLSPNTVRKHLTNLSKCLDSAVRQNIIAFNPVKRIELPKKVKFVGAKYYNEKQIEQLLDCIKSDTLEIVVLLTVFYGLRRSEVLGIKWNAVDFENNTISIQHTVTKIGKEIHKTDSTKNSSSYSVLPMPDLIRDRLADWKAKQAEHKLIQPNDYVDEEYVCTAIDGNLIKPNYVSQHFALLLQKSKCHISVFTTCGIHQQAI